jgi:hypothetical protein
MTSELTKVPFKPFFVSSIFSKNLPFPFRDCKDTIRNCSLQMFFENFLADLFRKTAANMEDVFQFTKSHPLIFLTSLTNPLYTAGKQGIFLFTTYPSPSFLTLFISQCQITILQCHLSILLHKSPAAIR